MDSETKQLLQAEKSLNKLMKGFTNLTGEFFTTANFFYESSFADDWSSDEDDDSSLQKDHNDLMDRLELISLRSENPQSVACSDDDSSVQKEHTDSMDRLELSSLRSGKGRVTFSVEVTIIPLIHEEWAEDYMKARQSDWSKECLDKQRFASRVKLLEQLLLGQKSKI